METRKKLTLPSGATCVIRKLNGRDFLAAGYLPDVYAENGKPDRSSKAQEAAVRVTEITLLRCVAKHIDAEGKPLKIVEKPFGECADDETSLEEFIGSEDAAEIIKQVTEFSGMGAAAKAAARPFPETPEGNGGGGLDSQAVRDVTHAGAGSVG